MTRLPGSIENVSAMQAGLVGCHSCDLLSKIKGNDHQMLQCPRCGASLHSRKTNSIARTWALVIAAFIFYVPAMVLPITNVSSLGVSQSDTIMSGVVLFIQTGSWEIALVIFVASIIVPMMKLFILVYLLISVQQKSDKRMRDRAKLYRLTEFVGRWSMVDIYVVTILIALVNLGVIADIDAGPAAFYFAAVVIVTIFAARMFDPRLIWDEMND
ncbi:MAG: paraquat-inducible protein A [Gammaproteobacteria bacterium]|nr:paraquat-inducible protein A [Gammaproteobacteria bacterium]